MKTKFLLFSVLMTLGSISISSAQASTHYVETKNEIASHTIKKTVTLFIGYGSYPPNYSSTYYYNDGLYKGILTESYTERRSGGGIGDKMYAWYCTYTGYVTSNSGQPINKIIEEEETS